MVYNFLSGTSAVFYFSYFTRKNGGAQPLYPEIYKLVIYLFCSM